MFQKDCPLYLRDVTFKTENVDGETRKIVVCSFSAQPFSKEMAVDLGIERHLFAMENGDPLSDLVSINLAISPALQQMSFKMAPDVEQARIVIPDVKISNTIAIRKDKEGPVLAANFTANFSYPEPATLLYLANGINNQHFLTFEQQQGALGLAEGKDETPAPGKRRRGGKAATTEEQPPLGDQPAAEATNEGGAPAVQ